MQSWQSDYAVVNHGVSTVVESDELCVFEFRDRFGDLTAICTTLYKPKLTVLSTPDDDEWPDVMLACGYAEEDISDKPGEPGRVRIFDVYAEVALDSHRVSGIKFSLAGDLKAIVFRQFSDDLWLVTKSADSDWQHYLALVGELA